MDLKAVNSFIKKGLIVATGLSGKDVLSKIEKLPENYCEYIECTPRAVAYYLEDTAETSCAAKKKGIMIRFKAEPDCVKLKSRADMVCKIFGFDNQSKDYFKQINSLASHLHRNSLSNMKARIVHCRCSGFKNQDTYFFDKAGISTTFLNMQNALDALEVGYATRFAIKKERNYGTHEKFVIMNGVDTRLQAKNYGAHKSEAGPVNENRLADIYRVKQN